VHKRSLLSVLLLLAMCSVLLIAAGCARPKPEAKQTPTVMAGAQATGVAGAPQSTVVTIRPTVAGTAGPAAAGTPTVVVIATGPTAAPSVAAPAATSAATGEAEYITYKVQWGDTLFSIAQRYDTSVEVISALNNISRPDQISTGMELKIPKNPNSPASAETPPAAGEGTSYTVKAGDSLNSIAQQYGVTVDAIMKANNISNKDFIFPGQKLTIPGATGAAPSGDQATPASQGKTHTVKAGETLDAIARMYGTTREAIVAKNNLANPNYIYPGQVLQIP
jgi:LysM repeat protein